MKLRPLISLAILGMTILLAMTHGFLLAAIFFFVAGNMLARPSSEGRLCATLTNLDNEIFAQTALEGFVKTLMPLSVFSTNFSPSTAARGNDVLVPLIGSLTATTFSTYNICGGSQSAITITLNKHKHVPVGQNDLTAASSSRATLEAYSFQAGAALGLLVFRDIMTLITTGNFSLATAVSVVDFGIAQIRAARLQLHNNDVPFEGRAAVLDVNPFDNLLGISNFIQVNLSGSQETLRQGRIGQALGFQIHETNALPGTNSVMGFFGHPQAIAIAMRYLQPQEGNTYRDVGMATDPATGLTIGLRDHYDNNTGTRYVNLECVYGYAVGISAGARVLKRLD